MKKLNINWHLIKWYLKQFPNLILRLITFDRCYVCDECHRAHKRDGTEIRFDDEPEHLINNRWWYGGVCRQGCEDCMNKVATLLRNDIVKSFCEKVEK